MEQLELLVDSIFKAQNKDESDILFGNYPSTRYHPIFPVSREEDNVYFVAWVNQLLTRGLDEFPLSLKGKIEEIIRHGEVAIARYRNRYGELTYNFYRPKEWFPNGKILSRFVFFQPTDDSDDTSIALRGKRHSIDYAREIKDIYSHQSNGLRNRFIKRIPKKYRGYRYYNTWIGSEGLYVDTDLVVLCNILMFNALYDLDLREEDRASIRLLTECIESGEYLSKKWSLSAWYPVDSTILYCLADLISIGYYSELTPYRDQVVQDINRSLTGNESLIDRLLFENALMKLGETPMTEEELYPERVISASADFTFGVIPLLHPFNGQLMQYFSQFKLFQMHYRCDAQCMAIAVENALLRAKLSDSDKRDVNQGISELKEKEEQDPISRIL